MMGSEIKLVSKLGIGSTFYFTLEMDAEGRPVGDSREGCTNTNKDLTSIFPRLKGCRTLVAAPRLVRRLVLVDALRVLGMEVAVVDDIEDAMGMLFEDLLRNQGPGRIPGSGRRGATGLTAGGRAFECLVVDADDWGLGSVLDLAKRVWVDRRRRGPGADCLPVVLVVASSFTAETEESIRQIPCRTMLQKPISSSACGAAIMKGLGQAAQMAGIEKPDRPQAKEKPIRGIHVLVVDDNLVNRKVACKFLEKIGISSMAVDSAANAIAALAQGHPFDAVFMDIQMPEMDGIEATQILRAKKVKSKNSARGPIPIFAMTADVMKDRQVQCREAGMDGFIPKPLDPLKLFDIIAPFFPM